MFIHKLTTHAKAEAACHSWEGAYRLAEPRREAGVTLLRALAGEGSMESMKWWLGIRKSDDGTLTYISDHSEADLSNEFGNGNHQGRRDKACVAMGEVAEPHLLAVEQCTEKLAGPVCETIAAAVQLVPSML